MSGAPFPKEDDLSFAIQWLTEGYEGTDPNDPLLGSAQRVAAWLQRVMDTSRTERVLKQIMKEHGVNRARARVALETLKEKGLWK